MCFTPVFHPRNKKKKDFLSPLNKSYYVLTLWRINSSLLKNFKIYIEAAGRVGTDMMNFLTANPAIKTLLVEKTDRLYCNLKDWVTIDELDLEIHFVKGDEVLSDSSRSSEKFMHGLRVLMAKNYIDNLSEETRKGMNEKAE